ncbi:MAG: SDR family NAD(P)-dependent oxidoreductase [Prolixibacteraceae bacterium]|nr:SDR family NAD(P)-dependent oxidoreductase [Prolixibacteraceae bacterium]
MNRTVYTLITGASSGIGKSIAWYCGSLGMNLVLVSLPDESLEKVANEIAEKHQVKTAFFETDLTKHDSPEEVFGWTQRNNLDVNILVNNAGVAGASVFETSDVKYIDDRILLNIRALVMLSRFYLPVLRTHEKSYILNVGSLAAFWPIPYKSLYSSSKVFVLYFSKSIRSELRGTGVSISVLCPNGVRTNGTTNVRINSHGKIGRLTELSVGAVAKAGIDGMLKRKFVIIPGRINWLVLALGKILPPAILQKLLAKEFMKEVLATRN